VELPATEGRQLLVESAGHVVQLPAGHHVLRLYVVHGGMELDRLAFRASNAPVKVDH
jgi:hypothetical protein